MKNVLISILCLAFTQCLSQNDFYKKSLEINKKGMTVLGAWGLTNSIYSGVQLLGSNRSQESIAFHQMNLGWGVINTAIAGIGYLGTRNAKLPSQGIETWEAQYKLQQTFAVNAALDVAYIGFGMYLNEKGKNDLDNGFRSQGFGKSIILQGAFLGVFDVAMYAIQKNHYQKDKDKLVIGFKGNRMKLTYQLD
jgi:hypothetical protein